MNSRRRRLVSTGRPVGRSIVDRGASVNIVIALALIPVLVFGAGAPAWAIGPTDELKQYTDRVLKVLQAPNLTPDARRAAVRDLAIEVFDTTESAKRALGPHWQRRTPAEREEFVRLFRDL